MLLACILLLTGCVSPASVPQQTHPLATALPTPQEHTPALEATPALSSALPTEAEPSADPFLEAAALGAEYLQILTGQDFSAFSYEVEFLSHSGNGEWDVSFSIPDQPVTANVRFEADGTLTFYALWTHGETDASLLLPLAPMPEALTGADYKQIIPYWYNQLPIREDAPFKRMELVQKDNTLQYPDSSYRLNTVKMRFEDGSVLTCLYDQGTCRLTYFCHYTAESLGR